MNNEELEVLKEYKNMYDRVNAKLISLGLIDVETGIELSIKVISQAQGYTFSLSHAIVLLDLLISKIYTSNDEIKSKGLVVLLDSANDMYLRSKSRLNSK